MAHIVLIEPDRVLAQTYCQAFTAAGHSVVPCASAQAAVLAADDRRPDVVVLELQLIEHSGIEFLYEFRSYPEWQQTPVIAHTTVPMSEFSGCWPLLQEQPGFRTILYKPQTSLRRLLAAVREVAPVAA
jgi:CheY-like chemotaxis protein